FLFDLVRNLLFDLPRGGPGPGHRNNHDAHGEVGIFHPSEVRIRNDSPHEHDNDEVINQLLVFKRPFGQIKRLHYLSPAMHLTFWPSRSLCTPAVTTTSPAFKPERT